MIKLPVSVVDHWDNLEFRDAEGQHVRHEDIASALNAAPKRAFGELSGALWGIYKAAADAAETVAGDPGGFSTSADWDYYERRLVDELEKRLQVFAAPKRAFEGLSDVKLEDILVKLTLAYNLGGVSSLRAYLQAFAAPQVPQWQPIETMPMEGFFDVWTPLGHFTRVTEEDVKGNSALIRATHWKPSCAAPEAQGGENG